MDLVNFENLKGDVAPTRSLTTGIQRSVRLFLHDDGSHFFRQPEHLGVEGAMRIKIAHGEANTDLTYPLMAERYQTDAMAVGVRQALLLPSRLSRPANAS